MAVEYNTPHFFVTFTANEHGLSDLTAACNGLHHTKCPVEATRIYNRRWEAFLKSYLKGASPIGDITRVWWRQEDQARGSLHVHKTLHDMGPTLRNNCDKEHIWRRARYATSYQI